MDESLFEGYENTKLINYKDLETKNFNVVRFSDLSKFDSDGVLKACFRDDEGRLMQLYSEGGSHVGVIAATRLGKTSSYVLPTIISYASQKKKKSMIISDPKGELYRKSSQYLRNQGYNVRLLNFRDFRHSEHWNPLTSVFKKYRIIRALDEEVGLVELDEGTFNTFRGKVYKDDAELRRDVGVEKRLLEDAVANEIDALSEMMITTDNKKDPIWEDAARDILRGFMYAMLDDSDDRLNPITEDTFSVDTILNIVAGFRHGEVDDGGDSDDDVPLDGGYFSSRPKSSRAYTYVKDSLLIEASTTRSCYLSVFREKLASFVDSATRKITSCNSFDIANIADEGPLAIFLSYRDELKTSYRTISLFVQDAYRSLIESANRKPAGKLNVPFCFILDEFGNFAPIKDFDTVITACAGRNIWFTLIMQSYAQLKAVYGDMAEIIRDNLNVHVFMGSNNPSTLEEFSKECGEYTRISPLTYINGDKPEIEKYEMETIPLMPKSRLAHFNEGECTVTEANCGYVLLSKMERYYRCDELMPCMECSEDTYECFVNPMDEKYNYTFRRYSR